MRPDLVAEGARVMTVCNACRCRGEYCPVFPALERRLTFGPADLAYLATLCHNCGECLYACQYAPPHEFAINVPRTLAELRLATYETYCWPAPLAAAFRRHRISTAIGLTAAFAVVLEGGDRVLDPAAWTRAGTSGRSTRWCRTASWCRYLVPSASSSARRWPLASTVSATTSRRRSAPVVRRYGASVTRRAEPQAPASARRGLRARRGSTRTVAALAASRYLLRLRLVLPVHVHGRGLSHSVRLAGAVCLYEAMPVALGTVGGVGLMVGPAGLLLLGRRRDPMLQDPAQSGLDASFLTLLLIASSTGLVLLGWRHSPAMPPLLVVHLGAVLALFTTLPYGKFVHGLCRAAALVLSARERATSAERIRTPSDGTANDRTLRGAPHQRRARGGARLDARHPHAARASAHRRGRSRAQPLP